MSRWFRHYAGMMRDEKLVRVALRSKQSIERVVWIWGAILESAAEIDDAGRFEVDADEIAYFLRADEADICAVLDWLAEAGRVAENRVVNWSARQFVSDRSAERQARLRARRRDGAGSDGAETSRDGVVTSRNSDGDAPETETETEKVTTPNGRGRAECDALMSRLLEAGGEALANPASAPGLLVLSDPIRWLDGGCDLETDILPTIRARCSRAPPGSKRSWSYFSEAVFQARDVRLNPAPEPQHGNRSRQSTFDKPASRRSGSDALMAALAAEIEQPDVRGLDRARDPGADFAGGPILDLTPDGPARSMAFRGQH